MYRAHKSVDEYIDTVAGRRGTIGFDQHAWSIHQFHKPLALLYDANSGHNWISYMQQVERVDDDGKLCLTRKYFTGNNTLSLVYEITEHRQRLVVDVTKGYRKKDGVL